MKNFENIELLTLANTLVSLATASCLAPSSASFRAGKFSGDVSMRGSDHVQDARFSVTRLEDFVSADHPLRKVRDIVNESLMRLNGLFNAIYADRGRASVAPEKLIRALPPRILYSVRSERQRMEPLRATICCFGGSRAWPATMRRGTTRSFPRTGTGYWSTRSWRRFSWK